MIFRKYSPMGDLQDFAAQMCEAIGSSTGHVAAISDRDAIIALAGAPKRELIEKAVSSDLEKLCEERKIYIAESATVNALDGNERKICVAAPIIAAGDITGAVALLENEEHTKPTDTDIKLCEVAAKFLGSRTE